MNPVTIPHDLESVLKEAWAAAKNVPGFLMENEARFLGTVAACAPTEGSIVEIGSFKGKSTVMLAKVAHQYGLGPIVAIDPHDLNSDGLQSLKTSDQDSTFNEFLKNIGDAGVSEFVDARRARSTDVAPSWNSPIRFLWIDGDHSYDGAKTDFDGFFGHLAPGAIVAFHDALNMFAGPVRVFVEDVLQSNSFGPSGFVHSIAWSQFRPEDGDLFTTSRSALARRAAPLIPLVRENKPLRGLQKLLYKLRRSQVPRTAVPVKEWAALLNRSTKS